MPFTSCCVPAPSYPGISLLMLTLEIFRVLLDNCKLKKNINSLNDNF